MSEAYYICLEREGLEVACWKLSSRDYCLRDIYGFEGFSGLFTLLDAGTEGFSFSVELLAGRVSLLKSYLDSVESLLGFRYEALFQGDAASVESGDGLRLQIIDGVAECYIAILDDLESDRTKRQCGVIDIRALGRPSVLGHRVSVKKRRVSLDLPAAIREIASTLEALQGSEIVRLYHLVR